GRDLFDLHWALTRPPTPADPAEIVASFQHYLKQEGSTASRAEFVKILDSHLKDRGFCSDMQSLLRAGVSYDPQAAGKHVKTHLLNLLPE
ncbi:MAG: nucleotidyl transferase AbiEii/AbiGii toxin family protein, partial [Verrucomicrobiae bacterium]|nr:nucleotidyl transferase AbiEii/AbiGii toxin family protein [Verrucomicrobiae bacterium]